ISVDEKMSFTPPMLFFIMGFKDLLSCIWIKNPKNALEKNISTHCEEDIEHWKWYVEDLNQLGYAKLGSNLLNFTSFLWSEDTKESRELIYKAFNYHYTKPSTVIDLILIEIMEATFGSFSESLYLYTEKNPEINTLKFFGETHRIAEKNHKAGNWLEHNEIDETILAIKLNDEERAFATKMVTDLFNAFEQMYAMWYKQKTNMIKFKKQLSDGYCKVPSY
ncbi:MAG: hypothetical protein OXD32_05180, partial [Endozoicomonadaceae bacterium]|nr:hypothetical protein [Endozoicomonadaceae bacterium]